MHDGPADFQKYIKYLSSLRQRARVTIPLFAIILAVMTTWWLLIYCFGSAVYSAEAVIGPPGPSPSNSMLMSMGSVGIGGEAGRILGGASSGGNDPFQEYLQLLPSPRLRAELDEKDHFLTQVFPQSWNAHTNTWKPPGSVHSIVAAIMHLLKRPTADHPDLESLGRYFGRYMNISPSASAGRSSALNMAGLSPGFVRISLDANDPRRAEHLLNVMLHRADEIIRQERLADIKARIDYIQKSLPIVTEADQKKTLIQILAQQEELEVMLVADKRYAHVLVSNPYASPVPVSPMSPIRAAIVSIFLSLTLWVALLSIEGKSELLKKVIARLSLKPKGACLDYPND
jgi:hypothetical protein